MLPASFAAEVPAFMATPTSDWASAGASFVPSPVIATIRPFACSSLISAIFASGVASARKSSTPASWAITAAVTRLSPVIITVRMPILRSSSKRSLMPPLTMSFRWMTPSTKLSWATTSGVPPARAILSTSSSRRAGAWPPCSSTKRLTASAAPLRSLRAVHVDAAHPRGRGERDEGRLVLAELAAAQAVALLGEHDDRAALRRLVGERGELGRLGELARRDAVDGDELRGLAVAERDRAGLVEQKHVDVAGRLDRAAGHREHVALHDAGPSRRCRSQRAARRSWSGSARRAARSARSARCGVPA